MKNFKVLLLTFACAAPSYIAADDAVPTEACAPVVFTAEQLGKMQAEMMQNMMEELKSFQVDLYVKHFDSVEWLEKNYCVDPVTGDKKINVIAEDFLSQKERFMTAVKKSSKELWALLPQEQMVFIDQMIESMLEQSIRMGFKSNSEVRSMAYQRVQQVRRAEAKKIDAVSKELLAAA